MGYIPSVDFATLPDGLNPLSLFDEQFSAIAEALNAGVIPPSTAAPNTFWAGPAAGPGALPPTFRGLASGDFNSNLLSSLIPNAGVLPTANGGISSPASRVALGAEDISKFVLSFFDGSFWLWKFGNFISACAADPQQGIFVPKTSDVVPGTTGTWQRQFFGDPTIGMFQAVGDGVADDYPAIAGAISYLTFIGGGRLLFAAKTYAHATPIVVSAAIQFLGEGAGFPQWGNYTSATNLTRLKYTGAANASTFTASISGAVMTVTGPVTGAPLRVGKLIFGTSTSVPKGAFIKTLGTGTGGAGTYILSKGASFTGSVAGNTLIVSAIAGGGTAGVILIGSTPLDLTGNLTGSATITAFVSGSYGGVGSYTLSGPSQTVASEAMQLSAPVASEAMTAGNVGVSAYNINWGGAGFSEMVIDGNGIAPLACEIDGVTFGKFDGLYVKGATNTALKVSGSTNTNSWNNFPRIGVEQVSSNGYAALWLSGALANPCHDTFGIIYADVANGAHDIVLACVDNCTFELSYLEGSGAGYSVFVDPTEYASFPSDCTFNHLEAGLGVFQPIGLLNTTMEIDHYDQSAGITNNSPIFTIKAPPVSWALAGAATGTGWTGGTATIAQKVNNNGNTYDVVLTITGASMVAAVNALITGVLSGLGGFVPIKGYSGSSVIQGYYSSGTIVLQSGVSTSNIIILQFTLINP